MVERNQSVLRPVESHSLQRTQRMGRPYWGYIYEVKTWTTRHDLTARLKPGPFKAASSKEDSLRSLESPTSRKRGEKWGTRFNQLQSGATDRSVRPHVQPEVNGNIKGDGQDCPSHTCKPRVNGNVKGDGRSVRPTRVARVPAFVGQECPTHTLASPGSTATSKATDGSVRPTRGLLDPQPFIVFGLFHQASADGILAKVLQVLGKTLLGAKNMVERFFLPDRAGGT